MTKCKICGAKFAYGVCPYCGDTSVLDKRNADIGMFAPGESEHMMDVQTNFAYSRAMLSKRRKKKRKRKSKDDFELW